MERNRKPFAEDKKKTISSRASGMKDDDDGDKESADQFPRTEASFVAFSLRNPEIHTTRLILEFLFHAFARKNNSKTSSGFRHFRLHLWGEGERKRSLETIAVLGHTGFS
jgi:hypothetical protein